VLRPGHHDQLPVQCRGHRFGRHDQVNEATIWAPRSITCDTQRAAPRVTAWAPRSIFCDKQRAAPRATAWALRSSTCDTQRAAPRVTA
jgi:hypothetical protein